MRILKGCESIATIFSLHSERPRHQFQLIKLLKFVFNGDPDPAFHSNTDPDAVPASKNNADPDPRSCRDRFYHDKDDKSFTVAAASHILSPPPHRLPARAKVGVGAYHAIICLISR